MEFIYLLSLILIVLILILNLLWDLRKKLSATLLQNAISQEEYLTSLNDFKESQKELSTEIITDIRANKEESDIHLKQSIDDMLEEAKEVVTAAGKASTSHLQRKLGVGYARAALLIDRLEEDGVIGPSNGAIPREVLISKEELDAENNKSTIY